MLRTIIQIRIVKERFVIFHLLIFSFKAKLDILLFFVGFGDGFRNDYIFIRCDYLTYMRLIIDLNITICKT